MAGPRLPRFIVIKQYDKSKYLKYVDNKRASDFGYAGFWGDSVFDPFVKIEVEDFKPAKTDQDTSDDPRSKYINLRFCGSNKYLQRGYSKIVAKTDQPVEDTSDPSCTLFDPIFLNDDSDGPIYLTHVHSGGRLVKDFGDGGYVTAYPEILRSSRHPYNYPIEAFYCLTWETFVKMPKHVAFKGDNGKYLQRVVVNGHPFLKFSSDDPNNDTSGFEVYTMGDGHVRIKSDGKFWRISSPNWIWADSTDITPKDTDTLFSVVKIDDTTIALRNAVNNNFCKRLTAEHSYDCLNAAVSNITNEARLRVQELVMEQNIYNVKYRMEDARIFDETPYLAGSSKLTNDGDTEASMSVTITYTDEKSYNFSHSTSITAGVNTSIKTKVPFIVEGKIDVSVEISESLQWDDAKKITSSVTASGTVPVPAKTTAIVDYVGTKGTCNVPYSYIQQDKSSTDGHIHEIELSDGIYTGVNAYNFDFHIRSTHPATHL